MDNNLVKINDSMRKIDNDYFSNYGGGDYSETYSKFTFHPASVVNQLIDNSILFDTILDAGCASGELVRDFRKMGIKAYGIENNKDILKKNVSPKYCTYGDLRNLKFIKNASFDVIYTNSLMYIWPQTILPVLTEMRRITKAVFLCNPFKGEEDMTPDPYRTFLATAQWWDKQFQEAGFKKISKNIYAEY